MGLNPLVNSLIEKKDLKKKERTYPLVVEQCQTCFLVQVVNNISANKIYRDEDYLYFSGDMPNLTQYFEEYAMDLKDRFLTNIDDLVVEIGSNDGIMLNFFKDFRILGIDPASNVVVRALKNSIPTLSDFFSERIAGSIEREFGKAKLIYGNNCIAHSEDLHSLVKGVQSLLKDDGVFVVECNYWGGMVKNTNYSLVYHDHFSYFSAQNWADFSWRFGLKAFDATITPAQGGSLRIFMCKDNREETERFKNLLQEEKDTGLATYETCERYRENVMSKAKKLQDLIYRLNGEGKRIAGYGAAAKGFSILKLAGIDERHIEYFVDDSPAKQGKFTPVSHIPVITRAEAKEPDYFFITAPNYAQTIMEKERDFKGKFILETGEIL